jgi:hypothetical protein
VCYIRETNGGWLTRRVGVILLGRHLVGIYSKCLLKETREEEQ